MKTLSVFVDESGDFGPYDAHCPGPLIRREGEFFHLRIDERKKVFSRMFNFMRRVPITYTTLAVEKKHCHDSLELTAALAKSLSRYLSGHREKIAAFDKIILYYDNGQTDLTRILLTAFNMAFNNVEYRIQERA